MSGTVTDLSRPAILNHLFKGALFGGLAAGIIYLIPRFDTPWIFLLGVPAYLTVAAVLRNVHALLIFPQFVMSHEGLRLRYFRPTGFFTWGMWRPWNWVEDATIPWSFYFGCRTFERSGGDPWDAWQALYVHTLTGSHVIGWDVFSRSVDELMTAVTQYQELEFRRPLREALRVNDFQRRRFERPLRLEIQKTRDSLLVNLFFGLILAVFVAGPLCLLAYGGLLAAYKAGVLPHVLAIVGCVAAVIGALCVFNRRLGPAYNDSILEFRADGLALGRNEAELMLVPWNDVLYTRMLELTTKSSRGGESKSTSLKLYIRGSRPITISALHTRPLAEISELLDPPLQKVSNAWQRIDELHEDIEAAALGAGLPATRPNRQSVAGSLMLA